MKKILYSLLLGVLSAPAYAQPVPAANMPVAGEQFTMYSSATVITHMAAGTNVTWDYSAAAKTTLYNYRWTAYAALPQAIRDSFPDATHATELVIGTMVANTDMYKVTSSALLSLGAKGSGSSAWNKHYAPRTLFNTPMSIGDSVTYNVAGSVTQTAKYDAWGTLKTPLGTFSNVMRIEIRESGAAEILYMFYQCAPTYKKLAHYVLNATQTTQQVFFYGDFTTVPSTVNTVSAVKFNIYPNPVRTGEEITIDELPQGTQSIDLMNALGEKLEATTPTNPAFNTTGLRAGVYFIRVVTDEKAFVNRIIIQ